MFAMGAGDVLVDEAVVGVCRGLRLWRWAEEGRLWDVVALYCWFGVEDWVDS